MPSLIFRQALRLLGSTGPNSCQLRITGTTRGRPFQLQQATLASPGDSHRKTSVSPSRGQRKEDTVVALRSHLSHALDRDLSHHCVFNVKGPVTASTANSSFAPSQQHIAKLPFAPGRLCRVHSPRRTESFLADLGAGEPPSSSYSLVKSRRPTPHSSACPTPHVVPFATLVMAQVAVDESRSH